MLNLNVVVGSSDIVIDRLHELCTCWFHPSSLLLPYTVSSGGVVSILFREKAIEGSSF